MKDNNLSRDLFPGLDFCEPTTSEMTQAAHLWVALAGSSPLPAGPSWGRGCVTSSCTIVYSRNVTEHIDETFHWNDGQCTAHYFAVRLCRVRAEVNILPLGVKHRGDALRIAQGIVDRVSNMVQWEIDGATHTADDHDDQAEDGIAQ